MPSISFQLEGTPPLTRVVGPAPMRVGREPGNDLVINEDSVSRFHAVLWAEGDDVSVHDLGSINGTHVNGQRITAPQRVRIGDRVRFGDRFEVLIEAGRATRRTLRYAIGVEGTRASFPVVADRFYIGADDDADLLLPDAEGLVLLLDDGELWLAQGDEERKLEPGERFAAGGQTLFVIADPTAASVTMQPSDRALCALTLELHDSGDMDATLAERETGRKLALGHGIRSTLFFVLGGTLLADREAARESPGWCDDALVKRALWGKKGDDNKFNVLLHRLRADLRKAQLDPWVIERRDRRIRARLGRVTWTPACAEAFRRLVQG